MDRILEGVELDKDILMSLPSKQPNQLQEILSVSQASHRRHTEYGGAHTPRGELWGIAIQGGPMPGAFVVQFTTTKKNFSYFLFCI